MAFQTGLDPAHVAAEVRRLVPAYSQQTAIDVLNDIKGSDRDVTWLRLAALRLSGGRVDLLPQWIAEANADPRDLKLAAEKYLGHDWDTKYQRSVVQDGANASA